MSKNEIKNLTTQSCPKCGHDRISDTKKCSNCGIYYEKFEKNNKLKQSIIKCDAHELELKNQQQQQRLNDNKIKRDKWKQIKESLKLSPKRRKNILTISLSAIAFIAISVMWKLHDDDLKKEAYYFQQLIQVNSAINSSGLKCIEMIMTYSTIWRDAIINPVDGGFNAAITHQQLLFMISGEDHDIEVSKNYIEKHLKELTQPTEQYSYIHGKTIELYGVYSQLYELAKNPSGSLLTYNRRIEALESEFYKFYNEINVLLPHKK
jgi:ribosomal protein L32